MTDPPLNDTVTLVILAALPGTGTWPSRRSSSGTPIHCPRVAVVVPDVPVIVGGLVELAVPSSWDCASQFCAKSSGSAGFDSVVHGVRPADIDPGRPRIDGLTDIRPRPQFVAVTCRGTTQMTLERSGSCTDIAGSCRGSCSDCPAAAYHQDVRVALDCGAHRRVRRIEVEWSRSGRGCRTGRQCDQPRFEGGSVAGGVGHAVRNRREVADPQRHHRRVPLGLGLDQSATNVPCQTQSLVSVFLVRKFHPGRIEPPRFGAMPVSATPTETVAEARSPSSRARRPPRHRSIRIGIALSQPHTSEISPPARAPSQPPEFTIPAMCGIARAGRFSRLPSANLGALRCFGGEADSGRGGDIGVRRRLRIGVRAHRRGGHECRSLSTGRCCMWPGTTVRSRRFRSAPGSESHDGRASPSGTACAASPIGAGRSISRTAETEPVPTEGS